MPKRFGSDNVN